MEVALEGQLLIDGSLRYYEHELYMGERGGSRL